MEKKILPPLLPGFELATFRSRVRRFANKLPRLPPQIGVKSLLVFLWCQHCEIQLCLMLCLFLFVWLGGWLAVVCLLLSFVLHLHLSSPFSCSSAFTFLSLFLLLSSSFFYVCNARVYSRLSSQHLNLGRCRIFLVWV